MRYKLTVFLLLIHFSVSAQILQGTVSDASGTVSGFMVVLKKVSEPDLIYKFTTTNTAGHYLFKVENELDSISVQAVGFLHESAVHKIYWTQEPDKIVTLNLFVKEKNYELQEVVIKSERAIVITNDTVTFNPASFRDGSERVIEDLLRKLPGIEVKQSGQILYKGKPIKKFLLDGDDLFDSQYTIGSRNIDVNMIAKVQAIDKFNENPLLKGLVNSEDVALNLQLVKGKSDFSANANLGAGIKDRYEASVTGLLVNSSTKGFVVSGYNTIGQNLSPYNFQSVLPVEEPVETYFTPKKIINEGNFFSQLNAKYHNFNSNFYTSINVLKKVSKKTMLKANLGFYDDKLKRNNNFTSRYLLNNEPLEIVAVENLTKQPTLYDANFFLENKKSKSLTWDFSSQFYYKSTDFRNISFNNGLDQNNSVRSYEVFSKQIFNLTNRIDSISAFKVYGIYTNGRLPQNFTLTPGYNTNENQINTTAFQNQQKSAFHKEVLKLRLDYYRKFRFFNWNLSTDYSFVQNQLNSSLQQTDENFAQFTNPDFQNDNHFSYHLPTLFSSFIKEVKKKYAIGFAIRSSYYAFQLNDRGRLDRESSSQLIIAPVFKFARILTTNSKILFAYKYNAVAPAEEHLFKGIILSDFRNFQNNEPNFAFINTHTYSLEYDYNNVLKFNRLLIKLSHDNRENNYFSRTEVRLENTLNTMFFLPASRRDYRLDVNAEQFIYFLRTYFKLYGTYGVGFDKNVVNNSDLRNVQNRNLNLILSSTPKINNVVQFENRINFSSNEFYVENSKTNENQSIESSNTLSYQLPAGVRTKTTYTYLIPDLAYSENFGFWDFEIEWSHKKTRSTYSLIGHNLLNLKSFTSIFVTDFSNTRSSYRLLERYFLFKINFKF